MLPWRRKAEQKAAENGSEAKSQVNVLAEDKDVLEAAFAAVAEDKDVLEAAFAAALAGKPGQPNQEAEAREAVVPAQEPLASFGIPRGREVTPESNFSFTPQQESLPRPNPVSTEQRQQVGSSGHQSGAWLDSPKSLPVSEQHARSGSHHSGASSAKPAVDSVLDDRLQRLEDLVAECHASQMSRHKEVEASLSNSCQRLLQEVCSSAERRLHGAESGGLGPSPEELARLVSDAAEQSVGTALHDLESTLQEFCASAEQRLGNGESNKQELARCVSENVQQSFGSVLRDLESRLEEHTLKQDSLLQEFCTSAEQRLGNDGSNCQELARWVSDNLQQSFGTILCDLESRLEGHSLKQDSCQRLLQDLCTNFDQQRHQQQQQTQHLQQQGGIVESSRPSPSPEELATLVSEAAQHSLGTVLLDLQSMIQEHSHKQDSCQRLLQELCTNFDQPRHHQQQQQQLQQQGGIVESSRPSPSPEELATLVSEAAQHSLGTVLLDLQSMIQEHSHKQDSCQRLLQELCSSAEKHPGKAESNKPDMSLEEIVRLTSETAQQSFGSVLRDLESKIQGHSVKQDSCQRLLQELCTSHERRPGKVESNGSSPSAEELSRSMSDAVQQSFGTVLHDLESKFQEHLMKQEQLLRQHQQELERRCGFEKQQEQLLQEQQQEIDRRLNAGQLQDRRFQEHWQELETLLDARQSFQDERHALEKQSDALREQERLLQEQRQCLEKRLVSERSDASDTKASLNLLNGLDEKIEHAIQHSLSGHMSSISRSLEQGMAQLSDTRADLDVLSGLDETIERAVQHSFSEHLSSISRSLDDGMARLYARAETSAEMLRTALKEDLAARPGSSEQAETMKQFLQAQKQTEEELRTLQQTMQQQPVSLSEGHLDEQVFSMRMSALRGEVERGFHDLSEQVQDMQLAMQSLQCGGLTHGDSNAYLPPSVSTDRRDSHVTYLHGCDAGYEMEEPRIVMRQRPSSSGSVRRDPPGQGGLLPTPPPYASQAAVMAATERNQRGLPSAAAAPLSAAAAVSATAERLMLEHQGEAHPNTPRRPLTAGRERPRTAGRERSSRLQPWRPASKYGDRGGHAVNG